MGCSTGRSPNSSVAPYVIPPLTPWVLTKLAFGMLRGKFKSLPEIIDREAKEVIIRFPRKKSGSVAVIDGELTKLADRVDLKIHPGALQVIVPRPAAETAAPAADTLLAPA